MKNLGYVLQRCEDAADKYFSAVDDSERADAIAALEALVDILGAGEMPLRLVLKCKNACHDAMMRHYGSL